MLQYPRWKKLLVLGIVLFGILVALPNLFSEAGRQSIPGFLPSRALNLGLDLQGGAHLLLEVETNELIREKLDELRIALRGELREQKIGYTGGLQIRDQRLRFTPRDKAKHELASSIAEEVILGMSSSSATLLGSQPDLTIESSAGTITLAYTEQAIIRLKSQTIEQSIEIIRRRVDETGVKEPTIQRQGVDRIIVQLPGVSDPERIKQLIGKTAKLTFHMVQQAVQTRAQATRKRETRLLPDIEELDGKPVGWYVLTGRPLVSGEQLTDARQAYDQYNLPSVNLTFNFSGAKKFAEVTSTNVGRRFAIVLDGKVLTAPVIREAIPGGSAQISGSFTVQSAQDLSVLLRAGALPAPLTVLEERTVGPGLGADSIAAGKLACLLAGIAVMISIIMLYGTRFGSFACLALSLNLILLTAILSALQATLTLPGIAGIVLTVGMAVDANVLIFERIREESVAGRGPVGAIDAGFSRAFGTIIDSNLTSLIAGGLLFYFGSGPVRGFAVTFSLGIMTSMFTTIMITRMIILTWLRLRSPRLLPL